VSQGGAHTEIHVDSNKRSAPHVVTTLLLHQYVVYTHFVSVSHGKMRVSGLRREKKMHDVSEPYIM